MRLEEERAADSQAVRDLHLAAFGPHGAKVSRLVKALRQAMTDRDLSLVAIDAGRVVGHVMFTASLLDAPQRLVDVQVLSPVAVVPDRQREGIGSDMIKRGLRLMENRSVPVVFVEGPPGYYSRFGFAPGAQQGFRKPSLRIPDAAFQALRLSAYESWMSGTLVYSQVFWEQDAVGLREEGP